MKKLLLLSLNYAFLFSFGCSPKTSEPPAAAAPVVTAEIALCVTSSTYASPVTVTGTASFYKRGLNVSTLAGNVTSLTLSGPISAPLPIKFAEVRVLNAAGEVVQCGKTNSAGALKL